MENPDASCGCLSTEVQLLPVDEGRTTRTKLEQGHSLNSCKETAGKTPLNMHIMMERKEYIIEESRETGERQGVVAKPERNAEQPHNGEHLSVG